MISFVQLIIPFLITKRERNILWLSGILAFFAFICAI